MYIEETRTYYTAGGEQRTQRGRFLLLLQKADAPCDAENTYGVVRKVAFVQCGQYMMGRVNMGGKWHTVSGAYGNDGLPMTVDTLPADAVALPCSLYDAWNHGGGWNDVGREAAEMRAWALRTFENTDRKGRK